uniref:PDGFA associated protein 1 n=1 Tax=Accipiter nisus TaxID=211598 RepID=A0A8B9MEM8_9AVES
GNVSWGRAFLWQILFPEGVSIATWDGWEQTNRKHTVFGCSKAFGCAYGLNAHKLPQLSSERRIWSLRFPISRRKGGHKGRARQYTSPEEIDAQLQAEKQKAREEEEQEEGGEGATGDPKKEKKSLDSDESDEDDEDYQQKRKGVEGLIDIENPNRVIQTTKKVTQLDLDGPKELSRREREEIEKQKAKERYMKMHLAGKTEQAKADLARLAIIRKQREEAARKKEEERKAKDEAAMAGKRLQSLSLNK